MPLTRHLCGLQHCIIYRPSLILQKNFTFNPPLSVSLTFLSKQKILSTYTWKSGWWNLGQRREAVRHIRIVLLLLQVDHLTGLLLKELVNSGKKGWQHKIHGLNRNSLLLNPQLPFLLYSFLFLLS